jgi:hypothetical protein
MTIEESKEQKKITLDDAVAYMRDHMIPTAKDYDNIHEEICMKLVLEALNCALKAPSDEEIERMAVEHATKDVWTMEGGDGNWKQKGTVVDPDMRDSFVAGFRAALKERK